jgi:cysteine sulfinate desulfinase/cysteine desulfurase-like protein
MLSMRKSTKIVVATAAACLVAAGGTAFTASNTIPAGGVSGYGGSIATGATVVSYVNNLKPGDASRLDNVVLDTTTDITGKVAQLTLKNAGTIVGTSYACSFTVYAAGHSTITCDTSAVWPLLNTYDETGLTVS